MIRVMNIGKFLRRRRLGSLFGALGLLTAGVVPPSPVFSQQTADPQSVSRQAVTPDSYVINIGDLIELDVLDDNEPPQRFTVGRDGEVQLPYVGGVEIAALSAGAAREKVRETYVSREIFVNPSIELSIAGFRPIAVLGDVREPGNFDFQPFLTAEQAVGLAGGPAISANNEEARVLERRSLEGTLGNLEFDLALAAAQFARVSAQLAGKTGIDWADVPTDLREGVTREMFDEHRAQEDQIIQLERQETASRRALMTEAATEAERRLTLLKQRETVQTEVLAAARAENARISDIVERGLAPRANAAEAQRVASNAEAGLLELREQQSAAMIQLADVRAELTRFDSEREQALRTRSQEYLNEMRKAIANRASIQDRIRLLDQWMNAAAGMQTEMLIRYSARRRTRDGVETVALDPWDDLLPGDLLVVTVIPPEGLPETGREPG